MHLFDNRVQFECVTLSLVSIKDGKYQVPFRSGLNWGQRPGRNENQAYLAVPVDIQRSGFSDLGVPFDVECDDNYQMKLLRARTNGKALQSFQDNAIIGKYFRKRLSLKDGDLISIYDLERYGRFSSRHL